MILIDYVDSDFGQSVKVSVLDGKMIVTEVDDKLIPKFKQKLIKRSMLMDCNIGK